MPSPIYPLKSVTPLPSHDWFCTRCGFNNLTEWANCRRCQASYTSQQPDQPPQLVSPSAKPRASNVKVLFVIVLSIFGIGFLVSIVESNLFPKQSGTQNALVPSSSSSGASPLPSTIPKGFTSVNGSLKPELEVVKSTWYKGGFGAIAVWRVTFRNNSAKRIGDLTYQTRYFSESGNLVDRGGEFSFSDRTIQKVIEPKKTRTIEINDGFTHSEAATANFTLKDWRVLD